MRILGIDPGTAHTGWGIVESKGLKMIEWGIVKTDVSSSHPQRLKKIYGEIREIIRNYNTQVLAMEKIFFNVNAKTALSVGEAMGVCMLAAAQEGIEVYEYTPQEIKQCVVSSGKANKKEVGEGVKTILGLDEIPAPDHATDALAVAICHALKMIKTP
ncbi:MAG: crossover junction endodeoxyribonuclease RuvC [Candidatus Syntropharchaeia archaeon]